MSCANWKSSPELCDACFFHKEKLAWSQVLDFTLVAKVDHLCNLAGLLLPGLVLWLLKFKELVPKRKGKYFLRCINLNC
jgi:hypothetical protein